MSMKQKQQDEAIVRSVVVTLGQEVEIEGFSFTRLTDALAVKGYQIPHKKVRAVLKRMEEEGVIISSGAADKKLYALNQLGGSSSNKEVSPVPPVKENEDTQESLRIPASSADVEERGQIAAHEVTEPPETVQIPAAAEEMQKLPSQEVSSVDAPPVVSVNMEVSLPVLDVTDEEDLNPTIPAESQVILPLMQSLREERQIQLEGATEEVFEGDELVMSCSGDCQNMIPLIDDLREALDANTDFIIGCAMDRLDTVRILQSALDAYEVFIIDIARERLHEDTASKKAPHENFQEKVKELEGESIALREKLAAASSHVVTLETTMGALNREIERRDQKIAELQKRLAASSESPNPMPVTQSTNQVPPHSSAAKTTKKSPEPIPTSATVVGSSRRTKSWWKKIPPMAKSWQALVASVAGVLIIGIFLVYVLWNSTDTSEVERLAKKTELLKNDFSQFWSSRPSLQVKGVIK